MNWKAARAGWFAKGLACHIPSGDSVILTWGQDSASRLKADPDARETNERAARAEASGPETDSPQFYSVSKTFRTA